MTQTTDSKGHSSYRMSLSKPLNPFGLRLPLSCLRLDSKSWFDSGDARFADVLASPHARDSPQNPGGSRKTKSKVNSLFSTHMAGTWMSEAITKGLSVWMGITAAKSQTQTVHTIRFVWFDQRGAHVGAARRWSAMCSAAQYALSRQSEDRLWLPHRLRY